MSFTRSPFTRFVCAITSLVLATSPALAEYQFRVPLEPHPVTVGGGTLSISTSSLDFGGVGVGSGHQLYVDVFNSGESSVSLTGVSTSGSYFASTSNCTNELAAGAGCRINVTFSPASSGAATGRLSIRSSDVVSEYAIALSGYGQAGTLAAPGLTFSSTLQVGDAAALDSVRVTNIGTAPVAVSGISIVAGGDSFAQANNCGGTLPPGAYCTINVAFAPAAAGLRAGTIAVTSDADGSPLLIPLSGHGAQASAILSASSFGSEQVGSTKASSVVLKNTGVGPLTISGMAVTGADYAEATSGTSTCGSTLAAGAECQYSVAFTPSVAGPRPGQASATTSAGVLVAALDGTGVAPSADLTAPVFGPTSVGGSSTGTATLKNTGIGALQISVPSQGSVSGNGYSFESTTCSTSLQPGAECAIEVTFAPTSSGAFSGTLTVTTGAGVKTVALGSTGIQGIATITPASLQFSSEQVGSTSQFQVLTVTNTGTDVLAFAGVGVTAGQAQFAQSNDCGSVAVGQSCTVHVNFTPTAPGAATGTLSFVHNGGGIANVSLTGTGVSQSASITDVTFGSREVASTTDLTATLSNTGVGPITVTVPSAASVSGTDFSFVSTTCSASLAAGGNCGVTVRFAPTSHVARTGTLAVATSAGSMSSTLAGMGQRAVLSWDSGIAHNGTQVGQTDVSGNRTLTNSGNATATGLSFSVAAPFSVYSTTCGTSLAAGATCKVRIAFAPGAAQAYSSSLVVSADSPTVTANLSLSGTGVSQSASITDVTFGSREVASTTDLTATLSNTGVGPITVTVPSAASVSGTDFSFVSTTCSASLAAGGTCGVTVRFAPTTNAARTGTLAVVTSAGSMNSTLAGMGQRAVLSWDSGIAHNNTQVGQTDVSGNRTLTNTGNATATALSFSAAAPFSVYSTTCGTSLAAGATCKVRIAFAPGAAQAYSSSLVVSADSPTVTANLPLSGTGVSASFVALTASPYNAGTSLTPFAGSGGHVQFQNNGYGPVTIAADPTATNGAQTWVTNQGTDWCYGGAVLAAGAKCQVYVYWQSPGNWSTSVSVPSTAGTASVAVTATLTTGLSVASASFGSVQSGQTADRPVVVTNTAAYPIEGLSYSTAAPFTIVGNACATTLAAGANCTVTVRYSPTAVGASSGALTVQGTYRQVYDTNQVNQAGYATGFTGALSGTGTAASLTALTTNNSSAGNNLTPYTSSGMHVWFKNTGNGPVTINAAPTATGSAYLYVDATNSSFCFDGNVLPAGANCRVYVYWWAPGSYSSTVTAYSTGGNIAVAVTATVTSGVSVSAGSFGATQIGQTADRTVTVTNNASFPARSMTYSTSAPFSVVASNCGTTLAANSSCTLTVRYTPTSAGPSSANLSVAFNYYRIQDGDEVPDTPGYTTSAMLSGTGVQGYADVSLTSVSFGPGQIGTMSATTSVTVTNTGSASLTVSGVSVSEGSTDFGQSNDCGAPIPVGGTCTVNVSFTPYGEGTRTGVLSLVHNGTGGITNVSLTGEGRRATATLTDISFGDVNVGQSSVKTAALHNTGLGPLMIGAPSQSSISGDGYAFVSTTCGESLAVGATCVITVQSQPTTPGLNTVMLNVATSAGPLTSTMYTNAVVPLPTFTVSAANPNANFYSGATVYGTLSWTWTNSAPVPQAPTAVGYDIVQSSFGAASLDSSSTCKVGVSVPAGGTCTVVVRLGETTDYCANADVRSKVTTSGGTAQSAVYHRSGFCGY